MDDLKLRVGPEPGESHSVCLDVWELPANLIGRSGGGPPPPLKENRLLWVELQEPDSRRMATPVVTKMAWKLREWISFFVSHPIYPVSCLFLGWPEPPALSSILGPRGDPQALEQDRPNANRDFGA